MGVYEKGYFEKFEEYQHALELENNKEEFVFFNIYMTSLVDTFKWNNLPEKMPIYMMERFLQSAGRVAFFKHKDKEHILPCFPSGGLTEYGEYDTYYMVASNGENYFRKADEIEICYNNSFAVPYFILARHFADKSANALQSVGAALKRASFGPILNTSNEGQARTLSTLLDKKNLHKLFNVVNSDQFDTSNSLRLPIFDNRETDVIALFDVYTRYRNLFYSTIGINNVEIQKRERLTEAEGSGNDEIVRYSLLNDMFRQRTDFVERVKNHFGYELEFEVQRDSSTVYNLLQDNEAKVKYMEIEMTKGANIPNAGGQTVANAESKINDGGETNE